MKTKAAVLYEIGKPLVIEEIEIPALKEGQVLVKVFYSGVCHTQLHEIKGNRGPDKYLPHLLGHEASGIVEEIGEGVTKVKKGDYVILTWMKGNGKEVGSTKYKGKNGNEINSGAITTFSEKTIVSENRLIKADSRTPPNIAALLGCAVPTGMGMVFNLLEDDLGKSIAIFGIGGIGSNSILAAKSRNYNPIIAVDIHKNKLKHAKELGATHLINAKEEDVFGKIMEITKDGADFSIEAIGNIKTMELAFKSVKKGGKTIIAGNARKGEIMSIDPSELNMGKKLLGTWGGETNTDKDIPMYEKMYLRGELPLDKLITKVYRLEQINEAFEDLEKGELCRALIDFT